MKRFLSRLLPLILVAVVAVTGLVGCSNIPSTLTGDYRQDTQNLVDTLREAIALPDGTPEKSEAQSQARQIINDFAARYRRDESVATSTSFTTMRTALNTLAGHYSSSPNRPLSKKLKDRLETEFKQVEAALQRGA